MLTPAELAAIEARAPDMAATNSRDGDLLRLIAALREAWADYVSICEACGLCDYAEGQGPVYPSVENLCRDLRGLQQRYNRHIDDQLAKKRAHWHEDDGPVLWWKFPVEEPPYVGTPLDDDFPEYMTHWTRVPLPIEVPEL